MSLNKAMVVIEKGGREPVFLVWMRMKRTVRAEMVIF